MIYVPLDQLDDNPFQRRQEYGNIAELAADILRHQPERRDTLGLQQIPVGRLVGDDGDLTPTAGLEPEDWLSDNQLRRGWRVQLEFGHRRQRAFAHLADNGCPEYYRMPVRILDLSDEQMLDGVWSENRARRELSAVEEAELIRLKLERLRANGGGNQGDVAAAWGLARPTIANRLRLLELPAEIQAANRAGTLSERQCLALAAVAQLAAVAPPDTQWTTNPGQHWMILSPAAYIAHALESSPASDAIREYAERATAHAGIDIPPVIGDATLMGEGIVQGACRGCRYRVNDHCMRHECVAQKRALHIERALAAAEAETGYPLSDRDEDFWAGDYDWLAQLRLLHEAGAPANFVIRWQTGQGYYPWFSAKNHHLSERRQFEDGGRAGIAVGHRGALANYREYLPASAAPDAIPDIPDRDAIAAWESESKRLLRRAEKAARAALAERLWGIPHDLLQALLRRERDEWVDDPDTVTQMVVDHLWKRGGWREVAGTRWAEFQQIERMMSRAGVVVPLLGDHRAADLHARAVLALDCWYGSRQYRFMAERALPALQAVATVIDAAGPFNDADVVALRQELRRALVDAQAQIAKMTREIGD